ncbi:type II secretion system F family protein [Prauserella sp. PE36]|uniref:type II secretion system F family protein n=1 Tax=Prauserella sp. PE36 TaxID=1504709 RepID=UPI001F31D53A|nr:type II secretion system F family protein [Prauserella sp. PE36]
MTTPSLIAALLGTAALVAPPPRANRLRAVLPRPAPRRATPAPVRTTRSPTGRASCVAVAAAVLVAAGGSWALALPAGALAGFAVRRLLSRDRAPSADPLRLAATGDLLAACLTAGLPVPTAVRAVAGTAPPEEAAALRATADLLALGAQPAEAWEPSRRCPSTAELARAACRTARSGSALAEVASGMAERARSAVGDEAEARAQRAGVLITGPLGLCFLPAFLCLGVVPVVLGLAERLTVF